MKTLRNIYRAWLGIEWMLSLIIIYPIYGFLLLIKKARNFCHMVNVFYWSRMIFALCLIPIKTIRSKKIKRKQAYIICSNHSSYLDIPMIFQTFRRNFTIIGKAELNKIPFFGFMFKTLYIAVDRKNRESRFKSFKASLQAINDGMSVVFFPEGTIGKEYSPELLPFQDGAFRVAIQKKTPIIPVTLPHNWIVLHDAGQKRGLRWKKLTAVYHDPIDTSDLTLDDVDDLKEKVRNIIQTEMYKWNPDWTPKTKSSEQITNS